MGRTLESLPSGIKRRCRVASPLFLSPLESGSAAKSTRSGRAADDESVNCEQDHRSDYRRNKTYRLTFPIPADSAAQETRHQGSRDTEQDGNDNSTRIPSRHDELCESADDQADDNH